MYYILYTTFGILRHHRQDFEIRIKQLTVRNWHLANEVSLYYL